MAAKLSAAFPDNFQITGYIDKAPTPPFIDITPAASAVEYDAAAARGYDVWNWIVRVVMAETDAEGAQRSLDGMLNSYGEESIKAILEADQSLGGAAEICRVVSATGYQPVTVISNPMAAYVGCEFTVVIYARGSS